MFQPKMYDPCLLKKIYEENKEYEKEHMFRFRKKSITEKQMIVNVLYLLLGMPNEVFVEKQGKTYILSNEIQMTHLATSTLQNVLKELIEFANKIVYIQLELYHLYRTSTPIIKCFCQGVFQYLAEIKDYFSSLVSQVQLIQQCENMKKITLLSLWSIVSEKYYSISFITKCVNACVIGTGFKEQVARLFDIFWEIQNEANLHPTLKNNISIKIFSKSLLMYFQTIKQWLKMEKISDRMEFFISNRSEQYESEFFLHTQSQIDEGKLPILFSNCSKILLEQGKTIRFINFYYKDYEKKKLMEFFNIDEQFKEIQNLLDLKEYRYFKKLKNKRSTINEKLKKLKPKTLQKIEVEGDNPYEMFLTIGGNFKFDSIDGKSKQYFENDKKGNEFSPNFFFKIKNLFMIALEKINKKCLRFFRKDENLDLIGQGRIRNQIENALKGIKKFMLCEQGDFIQEFLNAATTILDRPKGRIAQSKVIGCLEEGVKNSSAQYLEEGILNNISFGFIKKVDEKQNKEKLWMSFFIEYKIQSPVTFIYTSSLMNSLKSINNFIFCLKKGLYVLNSIWDDLRTEQSTFNFHKIINKVRILRNSIQILIETVLSHILNNIHQSWLEYLEKIDKALTVFEIVKESLEIINKLRQFTIDNKLLYNGVIMGLNLIDKFRNINHFKTYEIEKLEFELKEIVEIIMKVPELNEIINYNQFYDRID